jgi:hypothetical protein
MWTVAADGLSVTSAVNVDVPALAGVPLSTPAELSESPAGSEPALLDQVYGEVPPLAASVLR